MLWTGPELTKKYLFWVITLLQTTNAYIGENNR